MCSTLCQFEIGNSQDAGRVRPSAHLRRPATSSAISTDSGWVEVTLPVASERWLSRLLVRLGADVRVRSPAAARDRAAELATQVLARYDAPGPVRS